MPCCADVAERNADQVKVTGSPLDQVVETRECIDGDCHEDNAGRVHDHGVSEKDFVSQSSQRAIRQDVKKAGGSPGLAGPKKFGGTLPTAG